MTYAALRCMQDAHWCQLHGELERATYSLSQISVRHSRLEHAEQILAPFKLKWSIFQCSNQADLKSSPTVPGRHTEPQREAARLRNLEGHIVQTHIKFPLNSKEEKNLLIVQFCVLQGPPCWCETLARAPLPVLTPTGLAHGGNGMAIFMQNWPIVNKFTHIIIVITGLFDCLAKALCW